MQVYKAYFKIIRKRLPSLLIYISIFMLIVVIITQQLSGIGAAFAESKSKIAVFNEDAGAPISDGLMRYLAANATLVDVGDDEQSVQDALFCGNIAYALRIPEGFSQALAGGGAAVSLEKTEASGSTDAVYANFLVERYLNIAQIYTKNTKGMPAAEIAAHIGDDLESEADVAMKSYAGASDTSNLSYYFQYLAYAILAVMIMGVTSFMISFNDADLTRRNQCSPVKPLGFNLQIALGNATFAVAAWGAMCAVIFLFYGKAPSGTGAVLLCLNALAMTVASLGIGFFAGKFVRNHGVQNAIANVVSLGISFTCGVFVEQQFLGNTVLSIARFTPGYWYVKAVVDIRNMAEYTFQNILPVLYGMLIQLGFAAALFILALVVTKQRRVSAA
jgi:ABC-2 type transport system permease protein